MKGNLAALHQAHLHHCAGKPLDPPTSAAAITARISTLHEDTDRRLTGLGYQSELR